MTQQRRFSFLVVCFLAFYGEMDGQKNTLPGASFAGNVGIRKEPEFFKPKFSPHSDLKNTIPITHISPRCMLLTLPTGSYYPNSLGFICRKELQLDKITPIPLRFRLGSLEYVNWMEQKPNARRF